MLTRFQIKGFKNLLDTEVHLGPFTCIAGPNASGKSNLFDAIMFLHDLANYPIMEAASRVRDPSGKRRGDIAALFTRHPNIPTRTMEIEAEFFVPKNVKDDFDRDARPSATHLTYKVCLQYHETTPDRMERIELIHESLTYVPKKESREKLGFPMTQAFWNSIIGPARRSEYISTEVVNGTPILKLRQDGVKGRALEVPASASPRTVLGTINTEDKPTALAARRELQSWTFLQLEPSQLRLPDDFSDETHISPDGAHLAATLHRMHAYEEVTQKLSGLLPEIIKVDVDVDDGRRLKTLVVQDRDGVRHTARALSDGTLRFLALAILSEDSVSSSLLCLEEPENGIHPSRIPAIVELLKGIAVDPSRPVSELNPMRQVLVNTHSPVVVQNLDKNDLLVAMPYRDSGITVTTFGAIESTWRTALLPRPAQSIPLGTLVSYLTDDVGYLRKTNKSTESEEENTETVKQYVSRQGVFDFMNSPPKS